MTNSNVTDKDVKSIQQAAADVALALANLKSFPDRMSVLTAVIAATMKAEVRRESYGQFMKMLSDQCIATVISTPKSTIIRG